MKVTFHRDFEKSLVKMPAKVKTKTIERIGFFVRDPANSQLNDHALQAQYKGYRSINITGDYRAFYRVLSVEEVIFTHLGTHSQLYK